MANAGEDSKYEDGDVSAQQRDDLLPGAALPPGAHPRDIFVGLTLVTFAMLWAFLVSLTDSEVLYQFPLLALVAVLATGGLEAENELHELLEMAGQKKHDDSKVDSVPDIQKDWNTWTQDWDVDAARRYIDQKHQRHNSLESFRRFRRIGACVGLLGFFSLPVVLAVITKGRSISPPETRAGVADVATTTNGLLALCGSGNCSGLVPSTINAFDFSGAWTRQSLWCNDTASIECEDPELNEEDSGEENEISFALEVERDEDAGKDRIRSLSLKILDSNSNETVGIIANNTVDGLWWSMGNDWAYVKIRWSPDDLTFFNNSWINEDVFVFAGGLGLVETVPASSAPVCFSTPINQEYDDFDSKRDGDINHILPEAAAREIVRNGFLNAFYTNGVTGNPYRSVETVAEQDRSNVLLEDTVQRKAEEYSPFIPLNCAAGTDEGAAVFSVEDFLTSPDLEADRVHVVGAGAFSWEVKEETVSRFFTEQEWEGDDACTVVFLGVVFLGVFGAAIYHQFRPTVENIKSVGPFAMAGSLVGRIALVLIMAEGSIFLTVSSRDGELTDGDAQAAATAALVYKYVSWTLLLTVVIGDGICAPKCWFAKDNVVEQEGSQCS
eukprot:g5205.t1